jgi:hypothetical protein
MAMGMGMGMGMAGPAGRASPPADGANRSVVEVGAPYADLDLFVPILRERAGVDDP